MVGPPTGGVLGPVADFFEVEWSGTPRVALAERRMPGAVWFPGGSLNFGQHLLRHGADEHEAVVLVTEAGERSSLTFGRLRAQVAAVAGRLRELGVGPGDRVVGYLPNFSRASSPSPRWRSSVRSGRRRGSTTPPRQRPTASDR